MERDKGRNDTIVKADGVGLWAMRGRPVASIFWLFNSLLLNSFVVVPGCIEWSTRSRPGGVEEAALVCRDKMSWTESKGGRRPYLSF